MIQYSGTLFPDRQTMQNECLKVSLEDLMEVIKISPRGYCYGVVDALQIVRQVAKDSTMPRPIYIIGQIVHNRHAIEELTHLGAITLDGPDRASILEQVSEGTVIFTAHGVSPLVKR